MCVCAQLLSCVWLFCNPMFCNTPGSSAHGIFQPRILEWVAFPTPGDLPHPGIELASPSLTGRFFPISTTWEILFFSLTPMEDYCPYYHYWYSLFVGYRRNGAQITPRQENAKKKMTDLTLKLSCWEQVSYSLWNFKNNWKRKYFFE